MKIQIVIKLEGEISIYFMLCNLKQGESFMLLQTWFAFKTPVDPSRIQISYVGEGLIAVKSTFALFWNNTRKCWQIFDKDIPFHIHGICKKTAQMSRIFGLVRQVVGWISTWNLRSSGYSNKLAFSAITNWINFPQRFKGNCQIIHALVQWLKDFRIR